jgi:hypothetical protein
VKTEDAVREYVGDCFSGLVAELVHARARQAPALETADSPAIISHSEGAHLSEITHQQYLNEWFSVFSSKNARYIFAS